MGLSTIKFTPDPHIVRLESFHCTLCHGLTKKKKGVHQIPVCSRCSRCNLNNLKHTSQALFSCNEILLGDRRPNKLRSGHQRQLINYILKHASYRY